MFDLVLVQTVKFASQSPWLQSQVAHSSESRSESEQIGMANVSLTSLAEFSSKACAQHQLPAIVTAYLCWQRAKQHDYHSEVSHLFTDVLSMHNAHTAHFP